MVELVKLLLFSNSKNDDTTVFNSPAETLELVGFVVLNVTINVVSDGTIPKLSFLDSCVGSKVNEVV